jgi:predicted AlkP superfamily pyrophosphatase or phosphodiesterase
MIGKNRKRAHRRGGWGNPAGKKTFGQYTWQYNNWDKERDDINSLVRSYSQVAYSRQNRGYDETASMYDSLMNRSIDAPGFIVRRFVHS